MAADELGHVGGFAADRSQAIIQELQLTALVAGAVDVDGKVVQLCRPIGVDQYHIGHFRERLRQAREHLRPLHDRIQIGLRSPYSALTW